MKYRTSVPEKLDTRERVCRVLQVLVWNLVLAGIACGQVTGAPTDEVRKARTLQILNSMKQGSYGSATEEQVANAERGQLVPMLEERFVQSEDAVIKGHVAKALVDLGEMNGAYWDFLVQQAKSAIESDAPSPRCFSSANCVSGHPADYIAWARAHNVAEGSQAEMALYWLEGKVYLISGDPRGIPLLREALKSPYREVVSAGADGLARARDKDSIPLIVEACKRFHDPEEVRLIAQNLRNFQRDPETRPTALAAEEQCLPHSPPIDPVENLAILKKDFLNTQDQLDKARAASALIGLGEKDDVYWDFLLRLETSLLEGEISSALKSQSQGKPVEGPLSDEAWAKQDREYNEMLTFVETVAETRDRRGVRLLQSALLSPNSETRNIAASGLARAQDKDSVPLIIDACKNATPDLAAAIASNALVYFDDAQAQSAVDQYLSKDAAKFAREEKAKGIGPLGPWPPK